MARCLGREAWDIVGLSFVTSNQGQKHPYLLCVRDTYKGVSAFETTDPIILDLSIAHDRTLYFHICGQIWSRTPHFAQMQPYSPQESNCQQMMPLGSTNYAASAQALQVQGQQQPNGGMIPGDRNPKLNQVPFVQNQIIQRVPLPQHLQHQMAQQKLQQQVHQQQQQQFVRMHQQSQQHQ